MTDQFPPNQNPNDPITDAYAPQDAPAAPQATEQRAPDPTPIPPPTAPQGGAQRPAGYQRPDPAALRRRRQRKMEGFEFVLHATTDDEGNPTVVRARRPDLFDADSITKLPQAHQEAIFDLINETDRAEGKAQTPEERAAMQRMSVTDIARNYGNVAHIADAYVLLGFIEPRVYATEEEADANNGLWIRDIEIADRINFMSHVEDTQRGAAAQVATFPSGPDGTVDAGSAGAPVSGAGVAQPDHRRGGATGGHGTQ